MKQFSVVFSSATGNTALLAERLKTLLPENETAYFGAPGGYDGTAEDAEVFFVGFWTMRGNADAETRAFLPRLENKKVFLFGTAGFSSTEEYFNDLLNRVEAELPASAKRIGGFMCAGKMPPETCLKYRAALMNRPNDAKIMKMIDNFDRASAHPNESDAEQFLKAVSKVIKRLKK